jgi:DNA-binding transcriptional LysR family regulator
MNDIDIERVDLNLLKSLQALLSERHVGKAAKRMHISQSAMSHTLSRLRETFADPLFVRTSKGIEPTTRALALSSKLSSVLDDIGLLFTPVLFDPAKVNTRIRLQTHSFIISSYLSPFFKKIYQLAPKLTFETHGLSEYSYQQLDKGTVDLIIAAGFQASPCFMQRSIFEEDRVCIVDKNHPARDNWGPEAFLQYPHFKNILLEDKDDPVAVGLRKQNLPPREIGFYTDDMMTQGVILKDSKLISTLPRSLANIVSQQYGHVILPCPIATEDVVIKAIWHERNQNDQLHQWLRGQLKEIENS